MVDVLLTCIICSMFLNATTFALIVRELGKQKEPAGYDPNHFKD
jgi:hypothetical protein